MEMIDQEKKPHDWQDLPKDESMWCRRRCSVCKLEDIFPKDGSPRSLRSVGAWIADSSCIEPVPEKVTYEELMAELKIHHVSEQPIVIGYPGKWSVGFRIFCRSGVTNFPHFEVIAPLTMEHGFAELLRWIRAREYNFDREPNFNYLRGFMVPVVHVKMMIDPKRRGR